MEDRSRRRGLTREDQSLGDAYPAVARFDPWGGSSPIGEGRFPEE